MSAPADATFPHTVTELIRRANDGDQVALNDLFQRLYGELHTLAVALVLDWARPVAT